MPFGLKAATASSDVPDIVKFDARAGRMFKCEYNFDTREKSQVDITAPPPRFAIDFGSLEVGYIRYTATGPDYKTVPEGSAIPRQPDDKDDKGRPVYRAGFRVKLYGKILDGLREWSSTASCVLESLDDLYQKFRDAPEAAKGQIPIVELTRTIPVTFGKGAKASTSYAPVFSITGWTDRVPAMGARTVPPPVASSSAPAVVMVPVAVPPQAPPPSSPDDLNDAIPF